MSKTPKFLPFLIILLVNILLLQSKVSQAQDKIHFLDGSAIEVFIISIKDDVIKAYTADGKSIQTINTARIEKIKYKNGTTLSLNQKVGFQKTDPPDVTEKVYEIDLPPHSNPTGKTNQEVDISNKTEGEIRFGTIVHTEAPSSIMQPHSDKKSEHNSKTENSSCLIFSDKRVQKDLIGFYERENMRTNKDRSGILDGAVKVLMDKLNNTPICDKYSNFSKIEIELLALNFLWDDSRGAFLITNGHTITQINVVYYLSDIAVKNEMFTGSTELHKFKKSTQPLMFEKSIDDLISKMGF